MRTMLLIAMMAAGCVNAGDDYARAPDTGRDTGAAAQAVAGPAVTVAPRGAGQLAVSWGAVATAVQYQLFQSVGGGALAPLDTVTGAPPSTSYIADGLTSGVRYCYAVRAGFADGSTSDAGAAACATLDGVAPTASDTTDVILGLDFTATSGTVAYADGRILTTSAATIAARLPLHAGDRLKSIASLIGGDGRVDASAYSVLLVTDGVPRTIASATFAHLLSTDALIDVPDTTLATGQSVLVKVASSSALLTLDDVRYTYDHPTQ